MATIQETMKKMEEAAVKYEAVADAGEQVLTSEGEKDIPLPDGTTTPNLNKRIANTAKAVSSVNGKTGNVVVTREDLGLKSDEMMARDTKEDRFVTTESGRTQREKNSDIIFVEDFGAIGDGKYHPLSEKFKTLTEAQVKYQKIAKLGLLTSLTQSIDWASIQEALLSQTRVFAKSNKYVSTDTLIGVRGGSLIGQGVDRWDTVFPTAPNNPTFNTYIKSDTNGTVIYYYGTGKKQYKQSYISSCQSSGGWRDVDGKTFKLTSFYNRDATATKPATQKLYSVGFKVATEFTLQDVRLCPYFDGINGYNDTTLNMLADDWDVGIDTTGAWRYKLNNVQSVGYWREVGVLQSVGKIDDLLDGYLHGNNERGYFRNVIGQGRIGLAVRGYDIAKVINHTTNSFTVPWDEECFWYDGMGLQVSGSAGSSTIKYTSYTVDTTARTLTFNGVTPEISGTLYELRPSLGSNGLAFTEHLDCYYTGLEHSSQKRSEDLGLEHGGSIEMSGRGIRQPQFISTKFQTHESKAGHFHNCLNVRMLACQFEGKAEVSYLIASPFDSGANTFISTQRGSTDDLYLGAGSLISPSVNVNYFTPRGCFYGRGVFITEGVSDSDNPLFIQNWRVGPLKLRDNSGKSYLTVPSSDATYKDIVINGDNYGLDISSADVNFRFNGSKNLSFRNTSGVTTFKLLQSGLIQHVQNITPLADKTQSLGSATLRYKDGYIDKLHTSSISSKPVYPDNATAKAGGLLVDAIYRTPTGQLMIVY